MLEVIALTPEDVVAAQQGGADRVELVGTMDADGLSPSIDLVRQVMDVATIPVRVMVRTEGGFETDEAERLQRLAADYAQCGVDGLVLGFLKDGKVDASLAAQIAGDQRFTFHRAIDSADDPREAFDAVRALENVTHVLSAGSNHGVAAGIERLLAWDAPIRDLILVGGGLCESHVPQLRAAGYRCFHVGSAVRPNANFAATIDPKLVAHWVELTSN